ncbi:hypothetical protein I7Q67_08460 [Neisseria meningitidis]|nr:hypothetical protein [Neisseria meningitidis]
MNNIKGILLNLFFDDYGLPSSNAWVFLAIVLCIISIMIIMAIYTNDNDFLPIFSFALFLALFYPITATNPYNYIPISGTDIQKVNFKICTANKTVNHRNIKDIMMDCKNRNQEMKFKEGKAI